MENTLRKKIPFYNTYTWTECNYITENVQNITMNINNNKKTRKWKKKNIFHHE